MSPFRPTALALSMLCVFATGCTTFGEQPETTLSPEKIAVYESAPRDRRAYRVVKRIWVESWQSAFLLPGYSSADAGASDLREQAAALGGDAIINFGCYRRDASVTEPSEIEMRCNGSVIKYAP